MIHIGSRVEQNKSFDHLHQKIGNTDHVEVVQQPANKLTNKQECIDFPNSDQIEWKVNK